MARRSIRAQAIQEAVLMPYSTAAAKSTPPLPNVRKPMHDAVTSCALSPGYLISGCRHS